MMEEDKNKCDWEKISLNNFAVTLGKVCTFLVTVEYYGYLNIYKLFCLPLFRIPFS